MLFSRFLRPFWVPKGPGWVLLRASRAMVGSTLLALLFGCGVSTPEMVVAPSIHVGATPLRLVAWGDSGEDNASRRMVAAAMRGVCASRGCDLGLMLGDNLNPRGMESPEDPRILPVMEGYADLHIPIFAVLGNHDYGNGREVTRGEHQISWASTQPWLHMPASVYPFTAGDVDFFALDTTRAFWGDAEAQATWLREGLERSQARRKVVFGHHTFRSNGNHGNAGEYEGLPWAPYASGEGLEALFRDTLCGRADLYLSGHDHNRQWLESCGVQLLVSGAGSKTTPIVDRDNQSRFAAATEGFVWVEIGDRLRIAFFDARGALDYEGEVPSP